MAEFSLGKGLRCDLETLLETRLLVQGNSGSGKSHLLRCILEQTHGHVQQLIIDTEGEFYTLREKFDYVLVARDGGEVVADPRIAPLLTQTLLELGASAILDISELKPEARIQFVRRFAETLIDVPRKLWRDALIVFDEAQIFCPQSGKAESMSAINDLMGRARKRGFCPILATLRLSMLNKNSALLCTNKLIGQGMEDDARRGADELGFPGREGWQKIRDLQRGDFYAFGPALSSVVTKVHIGPTTTHAPERGVRRNPVPPATANIKALLPKLSDLPAEAEQERRDNETLRRDLSTVRRELTLAQRDGGPPDEEMIQKRVDVALATAQKERETEKRAEATTRGKLERAIRDGSSAISKAAEKLSSAVNGVEPPKPEVRDVVAAPVVERPKPVVQREPIEDYDGERVPKAQGKVLVALAQYPEGRTLQQIAVLSGYAVKGGAFNNAISWLRSRGLVIGSRDRITITEEGIGALGEWEPLPEGRELAEYWIARLPKAHRKILRYLLDIYPQSARKVDVGMETGYADTGGSFNNALSRLRTLELIDRGQDLRMSDHLS